MLRKGQKNRSTVDRGPLFIETVDTFATPAELGDDLAPADDEAEESESRDARLKREAKSLEHITTHAKKNPFCEHCVRGRMLERYAHSHRPEPDEGEKAYERSEAFGRVLEADHIFPAEGSSGHECEKDALVVLDLHTGFSMVYPGKDRAEDTNYLALKHFGGHRLNGDPNVGRRYGVGQGGRTFVLDDVSERSPRLAARSACRKRSARHQGIVQTDTPSGRLQ